MLNLKSGVDYFKALELCKDAMELCRFDLLPDLSEVWIYVKSSSVLLIRFFDSNQTDGSCKEFTIDDVTVEDLFGGAFRLTNGELNFEAILQLDFGDTSITNRLRDEVLNGYREQHWRTKLPRMLINGRNAEVVSFHDTYVNVSVDGEETFRSYSYEDFYKLAFIKHFRVRRNNMQRINSLETNNDLESILDYFKETDELRAFTNKFLCSVQEDDEFYNTYTVSEAGGVFREVERFDGIERTKLVWNNFNDLVSQIFELDTLDVVNGALAYVVDYEQAATYNFGDTVITDDLMEFIRTELNSLEKDCSDLEVPTPGIYAGLNANAEIIRVKSCSRAYVKVRTVGTVDSDYEQCMTLRYFNKNYRKVEIKESLLKALRDLFRTSLDSSEAPCAVIRETNRYVFSSNGISISFKGDCSEIKIGEPEGAPDYGCIFNLPIAARHMQVHDKFFEELDGRCDEVFEHASEVIGDCEELMTLKVEVSNSIKKLRDKNNEVSSDELHVF